METNGSSNDRKNRKRTLLFGIAALAAAGAIGAAFVLGSSTGSGGETTITTRLVSPTASTGTSDDTANPQGSNTGLTSDPPDAPIATPTTASDGGGDTDEPDDPTVTPDPDDDGCNFCEDDGDLAPQPTSTPSCAFCPEGIDDIIIETPVGPDPCFPDCIADVGLGQAVDDTAPKFESITTDFCYPVLQVHIEVDAPAEVWFEYSYDGHEYESVHMDAENGALIAKDMGFHSWDVYFIGFYFVHAIDLSGNHSVSEAQPMPDPDLGC